MEKVKDLEQARAKKAETGNEKNKKKGGLKKFLAVLLALVVLGGVAAGVWYMDTLNYVSFSSASVGGTISGVGSKVAGKVAEVKVKVGDQVKKGDVLFTIEPDMAKLQLDQAEAALAITKLQLEKVKAGARPEELAGARSLVDQAKAGYDSAKMSRANLVASIKDLKSKSGKLEKALAKFKNSDGSYDTSAAVAALDAQRAAGTITDAQYTYKVQSVSTLVSSKSQLDSQIAQLQDQLEVLDIQLNGSKAGLDGANSKVDMAKAGATSYDISVLENQVKVSEANYGLAKMNYDNTQVKATIDGTVIKVSVNQGDTAAPGISAVSLVDFGKLTINGNIDEAEAGKIKLGQIATFTVSAYPGEKFSGEVIEVGLATLLTLDPYSANGTTGSSNNDNQVVPVKIKLDGKGKELKPGLTVEGKIRIK